MSLPSLLTATYHSSDTRPWDTFPEPLPKIVQDPKYPYGRRDYERDEDDIFGVNVHFLNFISIALDLDNLLLKYSPHGFGL